MHILPINNNQTPNFNGKLLTKGKWTPELKSLFLNNETLNDIAKNSKYNIVGVMSSCVAGKADIYHDFGEKLYKLTLVATKENPSFKEKIKNLFSVASGSKKKAITKCYHKEISMLDIMSERLSKDKCEKIKFDLNI